MPHVQHWIIGTAGHIDHGKTSLVKALTGTDTDRLKEEKERGISIDLGFASLALPDGSRAGVVDVPGHERFIRNMLAGAHGIDLVLFTVAADDGVMPQTEEHLDIVHLLGIRRALFVITKADLASETRLQEVADEIRVLTAGTGLEGAPILRFAYPTGEGLEAIRAEIVRTLHGSDKAPPPGRFRLPVDRAFLVAGHGLIVTGTALAGEVRPGDRVRVLPAGDVLRVRSAEVHGEQVEVASWGQRIALNLAGTTTAEVVRGDVIVDETLTLTCERFDAEIEVRPSATRGLKDHQRVRVHLGTAERLGKIVPIGTRDRAVDLVPAKATALCQIVLTEPVVAMRGDHFIIRDETAQKTLAGGRVLLPAAPRRRRTDDAVRARVDALAHGDEAAILEAVVTDGVGRGGEEDFAVSLAWLSQLLNKRANDIQPRADRVPALQAFTLDSVRYYALATRCADVRRRVVEAVTAWHREKPLSPGLDVEEARTRAGDDIGPRIFRLLLEEMERDKVLIREGNLLRLPAFKLQVGGADQVVVDRIMQALQAAPLAPPDLKTLGDSLSLDRTKLLPLLRAMEKQKQVVAVAQDLYFAADAIGRVRDDLARDLAGGATLTTAAFRDRYQTSRKYAIPILEYFDRQGFTVRMGEVRRLRK